MIRRKSFVIGIVAAICTLGVPRTQAQQAPPPTAPREPPPADALCWALGTNLGIAAVVHEAGTAPKIVADRMETCKALADALGAELPALPEREGEDDAAFGAKIMHFAVREIEPLGSS